MRGNTNRPLGAFALSAAVVCGAAIPAHADTILDFSDVPPGTLAAFNPYISQGFSLTSTSGGFVFNSPDTGNGSAQTVGNNPFYAGANGFAAFAPATITLADTGGDPFSLVSIDLARDFAFDPAPSVTFTGTINGGGTIVETFTVTTSSPPLAFQTFAFSGFTNVVSVSWAQGTPAEGLHQFANVDLSVAGNSTTTPVPEPSTLSLLLMALPAGLRASRSRRAAAEKRHRACQLSRVVAPKCN